MLPSGTVCHVYQVVGESKTASPQRASAPGPPLPVTWKWLSRELRRWPRTAHSANHLFTPALLQLFALPKHRLAWVQGRARPSWERWAGAHQAEKGFLPLPTSACCWGHLPFHQVTSGHQTGQCSQGLVTVPVRLRRLAVQADERGTREGDRKAEKWWALLWIKRWASGTAGKSLRAT